MISQNTHQSLHQSRGAPIQALFFRKEDTIYPLPCLALLNKSSRTLPSSAATGGGAVAGAESCFGVNRGPLLKNAVSGWVTNCGVGACSFLCRANSISCSMLGIAGCAVWAVGLS